MPSNKLIVYAAIPTLLIAGAIGTHRYRRNQELTKQRSQKEEGQIAVTLIRVEDHAFRSTIPFTGTLLAVNRAELKAEVPGRVTRVAVQEGDKVAAGALLSAQDEDDLQLSVQAAEAQLAQAQAQAQQARRDNDRAQSLLEKRSVTKQSAQLAETNYNAAQAMVHAAESNLGLAKSRLRKSRITAPFSGEVAQRLIQPGEMLSPGQTAFTVVDNRKLEIEADLPSEAVANVKVIEVVKDWLAHGSSPEEMALQHPHLSLAQIHAALSHYYDHQTDYDLEVARELETWDARTIENRNSPIRRKLRAQGKLA